MSKRGNILNWKRKRTWVNGGEWTAGRKVEGTFPRATSENTITGQCLSLASEASHHCLFSVSLSVPSWSLLTPGWCLSSAPTCLLSPSCIAMASDSADLPHLTGSQDAFFDDWQEATFDSVARSPAGQALGIDLLMVRVWAQCRGWACWNADRRKKQSSRRGKQASLVWGAGSK